MRRSAYSIFLHLSLLVLATTTVLLARQNRQLFHRLDPEIPQLQVGATLGPIEALLMNHQPLDLTWKERPNERLLLVFTTSCPACLENQERWKALHALMDDNVELIGLSLDDPTTTAAYVETLSLPFDVVSVADRQRFLTEVEIPVVPFTIHADRTGRVLGAWSGALSNIQLEEIDASVSERKNPRTKS